MSAPGGTRGARIAGIAAASLCAISLGIRWPGVAMYDSVSQYEQALGDDYADWHPPIMARTWSLLLKVWPGTAPFLLLQMLLWWGGLGLLAAALAKRGRHGAAAAVLAVGAFPLFLGWATVVLKDAQMAACLVAVIGFVAHWRLAGRKLPLPASALVAMLLLYATLVRGNAVFATVPFALALGGWGGARRWWMKAALMLAALVATLAITPLINHRLLRAEATHNERALPLYDIVGIAHHARLATIPGLAQADWAEGERRGCYTPYFWNPYGEPAQCDAIGQTLAFGPERGAHILRVWVGLVATHPLAYALHRTAHFNANLRFLVGAGEPDAIPPIDSEPNDLGLGAPSGRTAHALIALAGLTNLTPLGWPALWFATGLALLWGSRAGGGAQVVLGRALAWSAVVMSGSFALASIASDLRYHLWSMVAVALAAILLLDARAVRRDRLGIGGGAVAIVAVVAMAARMLAPPVYVPLPAHTLPPPGAAAH